MWQQFGGIVPGGRASGGSDQRWLGGLSDVGKDVLKGGRDPTHVRYRYHYDHTRSAIPCVSWLISGLSGRDRQRQQRAFKSHSA